mmetsp:Transcript_11051/g.30530  ORF Transcript_11051/g.30530 Transcript_11051/m.30530 type:complete len:247 (+) Transcript_11051:309-1049(+)
MLLAEMVLQNGIIGQRNALLPDAAETATHHEILNHGLGRRAVQHPGFDHVQQTACRGRVLEKDALKWLAQTESVQDSDDLGRRLALILADAHDEDHGGIDGVGLVRDRLRGWFGQVLGTPALLGAVVAQRDLLDDGLLAVRSPLLHALLLDALVPNLVVSARFGHRQQLGGLDDVLSLALLAVLVELLLAAALGLHLQLAGGIQLGCLLAPQLIQIMASLQHGFRHQRQVLVFFRNHRHLLLLYII